MEREEIQIRDRSAVSPLGESEHVNTEDGWWTAVTPNSTSDWNRTHGRT